MAEIRDQAGETVGGLEVPSPDEARIRGQNAQRLARRRQAAALATEVDRTAAEDLDRFGDFRQVGGTFESLQAVPEREQRDPLGLDIEDIIRFLGVLSFGPREIPLDQFDFFTSFAPGVQTGTSGP